MGLVGHGYYYRKADRDSGELNPVRIQRYYCSHCHRTCSALPECIPPHRWYLWAKQEIALKLHLAGESLNASAKAIGVAAHTVARWASRLKEQFLQQASVLREYQPTWGRLSTFKDFWQGVLQTLSLAQAMRLCHIAGVPIP